MQLKIQRSQRMGGVVGTTVVFCLDVQTDYARSEADNIAKYKLGKQVIYNSRASRRHLDKAKAKADHGTVLGYAGSAYSLARAAFSLNISIDSLGRGQHIECKDLEELLETEDAVMSACRTLKRYLETAASFNGSLALIDFDDGEKLHTGQGQLAFAELGYGPLSDSLSASQALSEGESWRDLFAGMDQAVLLRLGLVVVGAVVILDLMVRYL